MLPRASQWRSTKVSLSPADSLTFCVLELKNSNKKARATNKRLRLANEEQGGILGKDSGNGVPAPVELQVSPQK